jgi:hypothetical protein
MAIPSGSGTEVLKRVYTNSTSASDIILHSGASAHHIYTFISIIICNTITTATSFGMHTQAAGGTNPSELFYLIGGSANNQALGGQQTFIFNDRLVCYGTDDLVFNGAASCNIDVWASYIDQDWS